MTFSSDTGIGRQENTRVGVSDYEDFDLEESKIHQRPSRVGRTHPGFAVKVRADSEHRLPPRQVSVGNVMEALVLGLTEEMHADAAFFCQSIRDDVWSEAA